MAQKAVAPQGTHEFRKHRMKLAIGASLISKITTALVVLGALPFVKNALGSNDFALYGILMGCLGWVRIFTGGLGPALTINMAAAAASEDRGRESRLFVSGMLPKAFLCLGIFIVVGIYALFGPMEVVVGSVIHFDPFTVRIAIGLLGAIIALQLWLSGFDAIQSGYQETHLGYIRQSVGNIIALAAIFAVARWSPSVVNLILAANLPFIFAQLLNAFVMLRMRPHLRFKRMHFDRADFKALSGDGLVYMMSGGLASYLTLQFPVVFVGHQLPSEQTSLIFISCSLVTQLYGMVQMIIGPLRPALSDADARGDFTWIQRAYRKALVFTVGYGFVVGIGTLALGPWFFPKLGLDFSPTYFFCGMFGLNFVLYCWENLHFSVLYSTRFRLQAAALWFVRSILAYGAMALFLHDQQAAAVYSSLALSILVISAVPYAVLMRKAIFPEAKQP